MLGGHLLQHALAFPTRLQFSLPSSQRMPGSFERRRLFAVRDLGRLQFVRRVGEATGEGIDIALARGERFEQRGQQLTRSIDLFSPEISRTAGLFASHACAIDFRF